MELRSAMSEKRESTLCHIFNYMLVYCRFFNERDCAKVYRVTRRGKRRRKQKKPFSKSALRN